MEPWLPPGPSGAPSPRRPRSRSAAAKRAWRRRLSADIARWVRRRYGHGVKRQRADARQIVRQLGLRPHPEGGFFRETYRSPVRLGTAAGERSLMTAILFLVVSDRPSRLHRLRSDEVWIHQAGDALELALLDEHRAAGVRLVLGSPSDGLLPQATVPAGTWQGARLLSEVGWSLVSCIVSPGFEYADFEMADPERLLAGFPQAADIIRDYTR